MREKFNHLCLDSHERKLLIHSLVELKNQLIQQGRYTDCVDELIQEYKQKGIDQNPTTGSWMWHGKEVHLLMDEDGSYYQNGSKEAKDNKIYLIVKREDDGRIKTVKQITMEEVMAERIAHLN